MIAFLVCKDMALILWSQIRPANCQLNSACAELFLRLHNVSPSSLVCEDAISSSMVAHCLVSSLLHPVFMKILYEGRNFKNRTLY